MTKKSNWELIRTLVNSAIDACENMEKLDITEADWHKTITINEHEVSVWDFLQSAWRYPEHLVPCLIRAKDRVNENQPFSKSDSQRLLIAVGAVAAELIGFTKTNEALAGIDSQNPEQIIAAQDLVKNLCDWYEGHMIPNLEKIKTAEA